VDTSDETDFGPVFVADAGKIGLVEKRGPHGPIRSQHYSTPRLRFAHVFPIQGKHVRPQVTNVFQVGFGREYFHESKRMTHQFDGLVRRVGDPEDQAGGVGGFPPAVANTVDRPGSLHFQMRVDYSIV
jgi:hypothetical protein